MKPALVPLAALVAASCVAFGGGLALPLLSIQPGAGEWTPVVRLLEPGMMSSRSFTLPGGIGELWSGGEWFLAIVLGLFSLVLPALKLSVLGGEVLLGGALPGVWGRLIRLASRYAMVEVFVIALLVMLVKGLPGGSRVTLHAGTYAFAASVLLSLAASQWMSGVGRVGKPD